MALLEHERERLCGPRYRHDPERQVSRAGYASAEVVLGGRRVAVKRPRVRSRDGEEVELPSWRRFASEDPLSERVLEQMMVGVATRKYDRSLEPLPSGVKGRGTSKSAVSRRFVQETAKKLKDWAERSLAGLSITAVMLDGIVIGEHTVIAALGMDEGGAKHVLGFWEGATENAAACNALLSNLVERGLDTGRRILFIIDGSKALAKAIRNVMGKRATIQRCQVHKKRNVMEHLPERRRQSVGEMMDTAYRCRDPKRAMDMLKKIARQLEQKHPSAATSLREGLEETLTVKLFQLPEELERILSTTNAIENLNSVIRRIQRNVKRWRDGQMVLRWVGAALLEAERGFRRIRGYKHMPALVAALRAHDAQPDEALEVEKKVA
jgi:transposase-like protein